MRLKFRNNHEACNNWSLEAVSWPLHVSVFRSNCRVKVAKIVHKIMDEEILEFKKYFEPIVVVTPMGASAGDSAGASTATSAMTSGQILHA